MADRPKFATTPWTNAGLIGSADTSLTAPATVTTLGSGGASGTKIEQIVVQAVGTTVAGMVNVFLHDGSTYHLIDQIVIEALTTTNTYPSYRVRTTYENLFIPNASWSLRATQTVAGNNSLLKILAFGASF